MTPEQFCYWLQGYSEMRGERPYGPTLSEWNAIQDHLKLVFNKVTPNYPPSKIFNIPNTHGLPDITC